MMYSIGAAAKKLNLLDSDLIVAFLFGDGKESLF